LTNAASGRVGDVALCTGNEDSIVIDLLSDYSLVGPTGAVTVRFAGGLLGHGAVWTRRAVGLLERVKAARGDDAGPFAEVLAFAAPVTDANAASFDAQNSLPAVLQDSMKLCGARA
jgi:hypothetical protein